MVNTAPNEFFTYGHVLHALEEATMTLVRQFADDKDVLSNDGARTFCVLSAILRRSIFVSLHFQQTGVIDEVPKVPKRSVMSMLDVALDAFAENKIDAQTHRAWMDDDIDAEEDDYSEIPGRHPAGLVAELCRDFGMVVQEVPAHWLNALPSEIRLLSARAAAAAIRPSRASRRVARLMRR